MPTTSHLLPMHGEVVVVRGGGDLATGVAQKLARAGMRLVVLEAPQPTVIRRTVALATAVFDGVSRVEDILCHCVQPAEIQDCWEKGIVPLLVDPKGTSIDTLRPLAVVDAIIAKKNLGTHRELAPITIALGPGFSAPEDVDCVIETVRGHDLGRLILQGCALPNTGIPGMIENKSAERVIHAPMAGVVRHIRQIGDIVKKNEALFSIDKTTVPSPIGGVLRGLIQDGITVPAGMKAADVDPRSAVDCNTISDKARNLGGAVLEALLYLKRRKGLDTQIHKQQ